MANERRLFFRHHLHEQSIAHFSRFAPFAFARTVRLVETQLWFIEDCPPIRSNRSRHLPRKYAWVMATASNRRVICRANAHG
jgi:hypothetical protein